MVSVSIVVVPESVLSCNHVALSLSVHERVSPPVLVILNVFASGFVPPTVSVKPRLVVLNPMAGAGVAAVRVSATGMVLLVAPGAITVRVALYVPATNPVRFTFAVRVPLLVPDTGLRVSHAALLEAA